MWPEPSLMICAFGARGQDGHSGFTKAVNSAPASLIDDISKRTLRAAHTPLTRRDSAHCDL